MLENGFFAAFDNGVMRIYEEQTSEIPEAVVSGLEGEFWRHVIRMYFCIQLLFGGIVGMSLINAIFVDAMVSDNNDDLKRDVAEIKAVMEQRNDAVCKELEDIKSLIAPHASHLNKDEPSASVQQGDIAQELSQIRALLQKLSDEQQK